MKPIFLTAAWRKLIMVNYVIDPGLLKPFLPHQTELDFYHQACFVSLVGFRFLNTRLKGFRIPLHTDFEEVNLRFYVRFREGDEWHRGTVFIKEIVPRHAITFVANSVFNENYQTRPMRSVWTFEDHQQKIEYGWKHNDWQSIKITSGIEPLELDNGREEEFIAEHYWGLSRGSAYTTYRYRVEHSRWQIYKTLGSEINVDFGVTYGKTFDFLNKEKPASIFLVEGSEISVRQKCTM